MLKEWDIARESEYLEKTYYSLSSRYLREHLCSILRLDEFAEKRKIRNLLQNAMVNDSFLDGEALASIELWKDSMVFSPEGMGWILSSLIFRSKDYKSFFEKAKIDGNGIDVQPILKLIYLDDLERREQAIRLLVEIQDKRVINPLLLHLKQEEAPAIKNALVKGVGRTGKKRAFVAIMNTLQDMGDRQSRLSAIDLFYSLTNGRAKEFLVEIKDREKDPVVLAKIDDLLSREDKSE
jgi:HEAT repeat protein